MTEDTIRRSASAGPDKTFEDLESNGGSNSHNEEPFSVSKSLLMDAATNAVAAGTTRNTVPSFQKLPTHEEVNVVATYHPC